MDDRPNIPFTVFWPVAAQQPRQETGVLFR
jgi:hypothetical protein